MNKQVVLLFAALLLIFASNIFAATPEATQVAATLKERTNGNDAFLNKLLSPGLSLDLNKNTADRTQDVNNQITAEVDAVINAFKNATEDKKLEAVQQVLNRIEPKLVSSGGAYITFIDQNPSAATSRTIVMIPKRNPSVTQANYLNTMTSYKRSAKNSDYVYEYETAQNLTQGRIKAATGSETSHLVPEAAAPFVTSQNYVLKKCRQLLGWRCVTSFYRTDSFLKGSDSFLTLFLSVVDLEQNPDHAEFAKDKRSKNQISGGTAVYVIKESAQWVLAYGVDVEWNDDKLSFTGAIQKEYQKDFARLKQRVAIDLKVPANEVR